MAFVVADRVKETTTTAGTGTITLAGAATGFQSFSVIGDGNTTFYTIAGQGTSEWEVGIGTYTSSGTTLSRDTVFSSSSGGAKVSFSAGTKDVFVTYPAGRSVFANQTFPIAFSGPTAERTYTLPDAAVTLASLSTAQTFTALQTFTGSTSVAAAKLTNIKEVCTISATAATGTIAYDVTTQSVLYYTSNASANWTVNFRGSSGTSLNNLMAIGESITVAFLVTQGSTAYYNNAVQVDGASVTPKYQGGTAWSSGNASSIDVYSYTIVKTANATFTVFASQTKFA